MAMLCKSCRKVKGGYRKKKGKKHKSSKMKAHTIKRCGKKKCVKFRKAPSCLCKKSGKRKKKK